MCIRHNESQQNAGEPSGSRRVTHWHNTASAVSRLVARLKDMADKLQNAYSGLDVSWSSAGQYGESVLVTCSVNNLFTNWLNYVLLFSEYRFSLSV